MKNGDSNFWPVFGFESKPKFKVEKIKLNKTH